MIIVVGGKEEKKRRALADGLARRYGGSLIRIGELTAKRKEEDALDRIADVFEDHDPSKRVTVVESCDIIVKHLMHRATMIRYLALKAGAIFWTESDRLESRDEAVMRIRDKAGLGSPSPRIVIVSQSPVRGRWRALPMSQQNKACESFWCALDGMDDIYVTDMDEPSLRTLLAVKNPPKVVALGIFAAEWLEKIAVPHTIVVHPGAFRNKTQEDFEKWPVLLQKSIAK